MLASLVIFIANDVFFATIAHLLNHHYHFVQGERKDYLTTAVSVTFAFCLLTLPYYFFRIASWTIFSGTIVALAAFALQHRGNFLAIVTTSFFTALHGSYYNMLITNYELAGVLVSLALDILHNTFLYDMTQDFVENYLIKLLEQDNLSRNPVVEEDIQLTQSVEEYKKAVDTFVEQVNKLHNDSESVSESEEESVSESTEESVSESTEESEESTEEPTILDQKLNISPQLAAFLKLENGERVSRLDITNAIILYINVANRHNLPPDKRKWAERMNPASVNRCLQTANKAIIEPDEALSTLLNYPAYRQRVKEGKQIWHRKNPTTGEFEDVVETNDKLTYFLIQHLLAPHLLSVYNPQ